MRYFNRQLFVRNQHRIDVNCLVGICQFRFNGINISGQVHSAVIIPSLKDVASRSRCSMMDHRMRLILIGFVVRSNIRNCDRITVYGKRLTTFINSCSLIFNSIFTHLAPFCAEDQVTGYTSTKVIQLMLAVGDVIPAQKLIDAIFILVFLICRRRLAAILGVECLTGGRLCSIRISFVKLVIVIVESTISRFIIIAGDLILFYQFAVSFPEIGGFVGD